MKEGLGIGLDRANDGGVIRLGRERLKQQPFGGEPIDGALAGCAVKAEVGFLVTPEDGLFLDLTPRRDQPTREKRGANIFDPIFDLALFPARANVAGDRFKEVDPGEVQESRMELDISTDPSKNNRFQIVVVDFLWHPSEKVEGIDVAGQEILHALGESEFQIEHPGIRKNHDKAGQFAVGAAHWDGADVGPVDLGKFARECFEAKERFGGGDPESVDMFFNAAVSSPISHQEDLLKDLLGGEFRVFFEAGLDVIMVGDQFPAPRVLTGQVDRRPVGRREGATNSPAAVSYTHLDVYKRQVCGRPLERLVGPAC